MIDSYEVMYTIKHLIYSYSYIPQRILKISPIRSYLQSTPGSNLTINSVGRNEPNLSEEEIKQGCMLGIDSHADSSCAGRHVRIMEFIGGKKFCVSPFLDTYEPKTDVTLINGVIAVDNEDGSGYILELNNFLNFTDDMYDSILVPMQARQNGIVIDDVPKELCHHQVSTQSVFIPHRSFSIPISYKGPIPYIRARYPTDHDLEHYEWVELTSPSEWNPYPTSETTHSIFKTSTSNGFDMDSRSRLYDQLTETITISNVQSNNRTSGLSPEELASLWKIPLQNAKRTLNATTNNYARTNEGRLSRRFKTDLFQKRYRRMGGWFSRFYTDTLFFKTKTLNSFTCAQLYGNRAKFCKIYPMTSKSDAHESLSSLVHEIGIPSEIHSDGAKEIALGQYRKLMTKYSIFHSMTEPYSPWQNYAEDCIRIIKNSARYFMQASQTPIRLLDHALMYACDIRNLTATSSVAMKGRTPFEITLGYSPDISEYTLFKWYQYVWYWEPESPQKQMLGRWLGVADHIGNGLTYKIINTKAEVVSRSTVIRLSQDDLDNGDIQRHLKNLDASITLRIGTYEKAKLDDKQGENPLLYLNLFHGDDDPHSQELVKFVEENDIPDADEGRYNDMLAEELSDRYIGVKVLLPHHGKLQEAQVLSRKRTNDGKSLVGTGDTNPLLDSRLYTVEFPDGGIGEFTTNLIAESLYSNIDEEGYDLGLLDGIIGHRKLDSAIPIEKGWYENNGAKKRVVTTRGWDIQILWKDGSTSWLPLCEIKSSNPIETAEYAIAQSIHNEPAFAWWVPVIMRQRKRMISRMKLSHRIRKKTKFGVIIPDNIEETRRLDIENGNNLWEEALRKELTKVKIAFLLLEDNEATPVGSKLINYHLIFDVKMDLTRKARLVAGGHLNKEVSKHITYSSVVSKESVRICFMLAALNNLEVLSGDIGNAYLNAKPREKCHVIITDDLLFGPAAVGKKALIVRALYGMKSSGAAWRDMISSYLRRDMGFHMCFADNDIWYKASTKSNGDKYYTYICIYVDDILICSEKPKTHMDLLGTAFFLKPESIKEPDVYLGADVRKKSTADAKTIWITGSNSYLKEALRITNDILKKSGMRVSGSAKCPYSNQAYRPEMDLSPLCDDDQIQTYQQLIGMLRWLIELGRVDVQLEVTQLSSFLACPRIGHLHQTFHIFKYLDGKNNSWIPLDPERLTIKFNVPSNESPELRREMMKKIYQDAAEETPVNAPEPRGKCVQINCYVDADHAGNRVTRRSQTGILIFLNMALVSWYSKRQNTVESSTFGSEFIAMRIAVEKAKSMRYKLRMMGIPIDGPCNIFADNESVVKSSMNPESTLNKKHVSIAYHLTRESFAAGVVDLYFINSKDNLADLLTKVLSYGTRKCIFECIFW